MLRIENVRVKYNKIWALRGVSLTVQPGQMVVLLGPNGAGKSTLLLALSGGIHDVARGIEVTGGIDLEGKSIKGHSPESIFRQGLSLVPEGHRIFPSLTVEENLKLGLHHRRGGSSQSPLNRIFELFPVLRQRLKAVAGKLSGGQQQQLAIAQALVSEPKILLLDEPSLGLSPLLIEEIYSVLQELRRAGLTLLIVEQRASKALDLADRIHILSNGAIELEGTRQQLSQSSLFHRAYFGFDREGEPP
ncbi:MAG: ABC transporter ATP-binding protein [Myxococcaceae bacterium]